MTHTMDNKITKDEWFERCWVLYERKGVKKVSKAYWDKMDKQQREMAEKHIPFYKQGRERMYRKDFERYLRDRVFENPVYDKKGELIYDPDKEDNNDEILLPGFQG